MGRDEEIDKELRFHVDARIDDLIASGVPPGEARRQARLEFGGVIQTKEAVRDLHVWSIVDGLLHDLRLATRTLVATPAVTAVAIVSLALGIGANTAIFSLINSLMLRALPVTEPQQLVILSSGSRSTSRWTYPIWTEIQQRADAFDGALAWSELRLNLAPGGEMQQVNGMFVSGEFFSTLGVSPVIGRGFTDADDVRGGGAGGAVAVISYGFWQHYFGGAASVVGARLMIERVPYTVVGVTPPAFYGPEVGRTFDVAVPIGTEPLIRGKDSTLDVRTYYPFHVMIRLKAHQSLDAAMSALRGMQPQVRAATMPQNVMPRFQAEFLKDPWVLLPAAGGISGLRERYERPLQIIFVVVGLVLLIACANIANLQLARTAARRHELSVRVALGASRWRLARPLLVESLLLATVGATAGIALASRASPLLVRFLSSTVNTVFLDLSLDWRMLAFTLVVTAMTTVLFGALPALRASAAAPIDALKEQGRDAAPGTRGSTASGLVVAQVALSLVLIAGAGLFIRTFVGLATRPLGLDSERVVIVNVNATRANIDPANRLPFYGRLVDAVAAVPGVAGAGGSFMPPVTGSSMGNFVEVAGAPEMSDSDRMSLVNVVTPGWFATYGTPIRTGRDFSHRDSQMAPHVAVVNEAFARKFFPGRAPMGGTVTFGTGQPGDVQQPMTIIGVVGDAVYRSLRDPATPTMYVAVAQFPFPFPMTGISIGVRVPAGSPMRLARSVASALSTVDPDLAFNFRLLEEQVHASIAQERILALLSGFFGALALLLAALGLYGLTTYAVAQRRSEIGIRMALGAAPAGIVRLMLTRVAWLIGAGVIVGTGISLWASTFVGALLFGLEPRDPTTLVGSAMILAAVGAMAGWLPAYRASRIDPAVVLRDS